ncbi:MAG: ribonuclease Y [Phycisphaerales bacterium]|nr:ribonuclease Y [Phycisphaerales bacterium]
MTIAVGLGALLVGGGIVFAAMRAAERSAAASRRAMIEKEAAVARENAEAIVKKAEAEAQKKFVDSLERFERETTETRRELKESEKRLEKREDQLDKKLDVLSTKEKKIEAADQRIAAKEKEIADTQAEINELRAQQRDELLRVARLTPDEARQLCLDRIERELERECGQLVERMVDEATENAKEKARTIVIGAIQRYAAEHTCESVVASIDVPSDDMKGRIIGREGRNIRAFEKATGVTVVVDDTPGIVTVSVHDPVRREVARRAMDKLIKDGRIHPARIEEVVEECTKEVDAVVVEAGRQAAIEANVNGLNKKVTDILGRMQFRTSYGQNVLRHSIEVAFLCGMMADELGLDGALARRCGLLHDIGKAMDHEVEGSHTKIGAEFVKRFNEHPAVVNACAGHHNDVPATHPYTPLVAAADAISAARPGARRESLERYIKRLHDLEAIATGFEGVRSAYAIEAGREVRAIVDAVRTDDRSSLKLARDIAKRIEETMQFPGEIKVTVLREVRATEYAISGRGRMTEDARP